MRSLLPRGLSKILGSRGDNEKRLCIVRVRDRECIVKLVYRGLLTDLALTEGVCGVGVSYTRAPLGSALRRLRADVLSLEVMLEQRDSAARREQLDLLRAVEKRIAREAAAVKATLYFIVCGSGSVVDELKSLGCSVETACSNSGLVGFFRPLRLGGYFIPASDAVESIASAVSALEPLQPPAEGEAGFPIGFEPRLRAAAWLVVRGPEGARHSVVVGPTGRGKTSLLTLIAGLGLLVGLRVAVLDAKGDLVRYILELLPPSCLERLAIVEPEESEAVLRSVAEEARLSPSTRLRRVLIIDEAWQVRRALLSSVYRLARSAGTAVVASTQYPDDLGGVVWSNAANVVAFTSDDEDYVKALRRRVRVKRLPARLGLGEALVWRGGEAVPVRLFNPFALLGGLKANSLNGRAAARPQATGRYYG